MNGRFVLLGVAPSRQRWFSDLARWATTAVAPIDFVKCLTVDEVRAVLGSGRRVSAVLVDARAPLVDRELVALADSAGCAVIVVSDGRIRRDWDALGCAAVLDDGFTRDQLVDVLERQCRPIERDVRGTGAVSVEPEPPRSSTLIGVTGAGGVGVSTVAMTLAQTLADELGERSTALADGSRRGDLAMYHDVGDVIPGLPELVESHRVDQPDPDEIRRLLFRIVDRRYDVLLGLRRPRDWAGMRPRSVEAAIGGLGRSYDTVVVDLDPDLEGEPETGSLDVEDRHAVTRSVVATADLVVVVGLPGLKGLNDVVRLVDELGDADVPRHRLLPVINRAPRTPAARASITSTLAQLTTAVAGDEHEVPPPVFIGASRAVERAHRDVTSLPAAMTRPLGRAVRRLLLDVGPRSDRPPVGHRIAPGELGALPRTTEFGVVSTADAEGRLDGRPDVA